MLISHFASAFGEQSPPDPWPCEPHSLENPGYAYGVAYLMEQLLLVTSTDWSCLLLEWTPGRIQEFAKGGRSLPFLSAPLLLSLSPLPLIPPVRNRAP